MQNLNILEVYCASEEFLFLTVHLFLSLDVLIRLLVSGFDLGLLCLEAMCPDQWGVL